MTKLSIQNSASSRQKRAPAQGKRAEKSIFAKAGDALASFGAKRYGGKSGMSTLASDMRAMKMLLNTENKHIDSLFTVQTCTAAAPLILALANPIEGLDNNNRTGRSIKLDRIDAVIEFSWNGGTGASATVYTQVFRWFIVKYLKTQSNAAFAINDFLDQDANTNNSTLSLPNSDLSEDFRIMDQGKVTVQQQATNTQSQSVHDISIPCGFHQFFDGTTSASIVDGQIFFVCVGLVTSGVGGASAIIPQFRTWYVDN